MQARITLHRLQLATLMAFDIKRRQDRSTDDRAYIARTDVSLTVIYKKAGTVLGDDVDAFGLAADTGPIDALAEAILSGGYEPWSPAGRVHDAPGTLADDIDRMFAEERAK